MLEAILGYLVLEGTTLTCIPYDPEHEPVIIECEVYANEEKCLEVIEDMAAAFEGEDIPCEHIRE